MNRGVMSNDNSDDKDMPVHIRSLIRAYFADMFIRIYWFFKRA